MLRSGPTGVLVGEEQGIHRVKMVASLPILGGDPFKAGSETAKKVAFGPGERHGIPLPRYSALRGRCARICGLFQIPESVADSLTNFDKGQGPPVYTAIAQPLHRYTKECRAFVLVQESIVPQSGNLYRQFSECAVLLVFVALVSLCDEIDLIAHDSSRHRYLVWIQRYPEKLRNSNYLG